jgi:hypothetical protein
MLRLLAVLLIVANLLVLAWSRGWLDGPLGVRAQGDREPQRLARQIRPDAIVLHPATAAASAAPVLVCLEAGPLAAAEVPAAREVLAPLVPAARVSEVVDASGAVLLRIDRADEALAAQLLALRTDALRGFRRCGS